MLLAVSVLSTLAAVSWPYPTCSQGLNASAGKEIYVISVDSMTDDQQVAVGSLQGAVGRQRPLIYAGDVTDYNLVSLVKYFGVKPVVVGNFSDLLAKVSSTGMLPKKYALYNDTPGQPGELLRNAALSLASLPEPGIAITKEYVALAQQYGMTAINTNTDLSQQEVWREHKSKYSNRILIQSHTPQLSDYAVFTGAFAFYADPLSDLEPALMAETFRNLQPLSAVLGWIPGPVPREDVFVSAAADVQSYVHCADNARNLATLSQFDIPKFQQGQGKRVPKSDHVHTVTFLVSDGDSFVYDFYTFLSTQWYLSSERVGSSPVPLGWTLSSTLSLMAPATLANVYANMTENDEFVSGPSGAGYAYPDRMANAADFAELTAQAMEKTDQAAVNVITGKPYETVFDPVPIAEPFLEQDQIKSVIVYNYFDYAIMQGQIVKGAKNKPIVGARAWMCNLATDFDCITACGPECVTLNTTKNILRMQSKDTTSLRSYSLIAVDAWHNNYESVQKIMSELHAEGGFRFVLPSQFIEEVTALL
eukprot:TRINITY_DN26605_c0_g1_i1.p1 TRINITY_DN26605_c0_g1~~TRINITY_DN26605_c0_g1_i1.p1  ORF type:complete len:550 (+),score=167.94 TRINITY_DN26605_c0_g1_i1:49-1650(+)